MAFHHVYPRVVKKVAKPDDESDVTSRNKDEGRVEGCTRSIFVLGIEKEKKAIKLQWQEVKSILACAWSQTIYQFDRSFNGGRI